jgi:hypothetical protein
MAPLGPEKNHEGRDKSRPYISLIFFSHFPLAGVADSSEGF